MTIKNKILEFIWSNGGGYIQDLGNSIGLIVACPLYAYGIRVDSSHMTIDSQGSYRLIQGIACNLSQVTLPSIVKAIVIGNQIYEVYDMQVTSRFNTPGIGLVLVYSARCREIMPDRKGPTPVNREAWRRY